MIQELAFVKYSHKVILTFFFCTLCHYTLLLFFLKKKNLLLHPGVIADVMFFCFFPNSPQIYWELYRYYW